MMSFIMSVLGWILSFLFNIVSNYGIAIILFTLLVKLLLFPLELKQKRSMSKTQKIQPLLMEVQKKYANDKEKLSQETMKLYKKYGISPMSGCLPMLIQLPIIFALFYVIRKPLIYMVGIEFNETWRIAEAFEYWVANIASPEQLATVPAAIKTAIENGENLVAGSNLFGNYEINIAEIIANNPEILNHPFILEHWGASGIPSIDFNFLGMNLAKNPSFGAIISLFSGKVPPVGTMLLWIIPVASGASAFLSAYLSSEKKPKQQKHVILAENEKPQSSGGSDTMKSMSKIMPLFSVVFAFSLPAGVGLYWTTSNLIQIALHFIVKKYFDVEINLEELEGEKKHGKNRKKRKNAR